MTWAPWSFCCGKWSEKHLPLIFSFYLHLKPSDCPLQCVKVTGKVRSEPSSNAFSRLSHALNAELNKKFGCLEALNLELNIGQVLTGSGSNRGSGPNLGITKLHVRRSVPRHTSYWQCWSLPLYFMRCHPSQGRGQQEKESRIQ